MVAPFEKTIEGSREELGQIVARSEFASLAERNAEDKIIDQEFDGVDGAIDLIGEYFSYMIERETNDVDLGSVAWDERDAATMAITVSTGRLHDRLLRGEAIGKLKYAIQDAAKGDYIKLIDNIKDEVTFIREEQENDNVIVKRMEDLAQGLEKIAQVLPTHSSHVFKIPYPAYLDPRFNLDASPLPLKPVETQD